MPRDLTTGALLAGALVAAASGIAAAQPLLASAPVDASVFRDGEVQRSAKLFGRWILVCDSIARLGHKFCSLRSAPVQFAGAAVDLLVSTGDDGRPAALMRLPFGVWLPAGLTVDPLGPGHAAARRVPVAMCGSAGCEAVWTLTAAEITALRTGSGLRLSARLGQSGIASGRLPFAVAVTVPAHGFAEAVTASLR